MPFQYRESLVVSADDVKCVRPYVNVAQPCVPHFAASSRDGTISLFMLNFAFSASGASGGTVAPEFVLAQKLEGHGAGVLFLETTQPCADFPSGCIWSASADKTVILWAPSFEDISSSSSSNNSSSGGSSNKGGDDGSTAAKQTFSLLNVVTGHTNAVCAVSFSPTSSLLVTASWDHTIRVHKVRNSGVDIECVGIVRSHHLPVWSVRIATFDLFSASADKTVRRFELDADLVERCVSGEPSEQIVKKQTVVGSHDDVARVVALAPLFEQVVQDHEWSPAYHAGTVGLLSASNDSLVGVFASDGPLRILHGHQSFVYDLQVLGSLLLSASEDRTARVWNFAKDGPCVEALPLPCSAWSACFLSVLNAPHGYTGPRLYIAVACADGTVRLFANLPPISATDASLATAAASYEEELKAAQVPLQTLFSYAKQPSSELSEGSFVVTDGRVFLKHRDRYVDVGEAIARPPRAKVPYAGKLYDFIFEVDLPQDRGKAKLPFNVGDNPYMAAQTFIEDNDLGQDYLNQIAQFIEDNTRGVEVGTESADGPLASLQNSQSAKNGEAAAAAAAEKGIVQKTAVLPFATMFSFGQVQFEPMLKKLQEFHEGQRSQSHPAALTDAEWSTLQIGLLTLQTLLSNPLQTSNSIRLSDREFAVLRKIVRDWPVDRQFPALDVMRYLALQNPSRTPFTPQDFELLEMSVLANVSSAPRPVLLVVLRLFTNALASPSHQLIVLPILVRFASDEQSIMHIASKKDDVQSRLALSQLLLNLVILLHATQHADGLCRLAKLVSRVLLEESDPQITLRLTAAVGTAVYALKVYAVKHALDDPIPADLALVHSTWNAVRDDSRLRETLESLKRGGQSIESMNDKSVKDLANLARESIHLLDGDTSS
eukprot:ANDGO_05774.mRNA.1 Ubiquitin homeostasis protein lub1